MTKGKTVTSPSGYLAAREEWDERYGSLIVSAKNWRALAILTLCALLISLTLNCLQAKQAKVIPYVAVVDPTGKLLSQGAASVAPVADDRLKRAALTGFVENWRMVSIDPAVNLTSIDKVYAMIAKDSAAVQQVGDFYRAGSPYERAEKETASVDVHSIVATSDQTYEVEWTERTMNLDGTLKSEANWKGAFTLRVHPPSTEKLARINPLGIYVTNINTSKVL